MAGSDTRGVGRPTCGGWPPTRHCTTTGGRCRCSGSTTACGISGRVGTMSERVGPAIDPLAANGRPSRVGNDENESGEEGNTEGETGSGSGPGVDYEIAVCPACESEPVRVVFGGVGECGNWHCPVETYDVQWPANDRISDVNVNDRTSTSENEQEHGTEDDDRTVYRMDGADRYRADQHCSRLETSSLIPTELPLSRARTVTDWPCQCVSRADAAERERPRPPDEERAVDADRWRVRVHPRDHVPGGRRVRRLHDVVADRARSVAPVAARRECGERARRGPPRPSGRPSRGRLLPGGDGPPRVEDADPSTDG